MAHERRLIGTDLFGQPVYDDSRSMKDYFTVPPFSVINTTDNEWLKRKRRWNDMIGDTGQARTKAVAINMKSSKTHGPDKFKGGYTSLLDACLAEMCIKWFTEEGWHTFDPFAGDTVFGFVSGWLDRPFTGIEVRQEQADFNQGRCDEHNLKCKYICDTSANMDAYIQPNSKDFIFSCPPYANLERYSDLEDDISTKSIPEFFDIYGKILANTYSKLKNNRFAVVVVGEARDNKHGLIGLIPKTINIMEEAGYVYYNDIILMNAIGSLMLRAGNQMNTSRKIGRRHQYVLVFYKGDPNKIRDNFSIIMPKNIRYENTDSV